MEIFMSMIGTMLLLKYILPRGNFWLIDGKGKTLVKITLDVFHLNITRNFIFFKTTDDDDTIWVYCFKRKGNESQDLTRMSGIIASEE
ncbi:MAG: hypothetical protein GY950_10365 [bacterium]|nr:hypothetical protein [bacterium]